MAGLRRAAFLDRDGVINLDRGYVYRVEDFTFVPGVLEAAHRLHCAGFVLVVVTNQSGIGRGLYSPADFDALTAWMAQRFAAAGAPLGRVYFCPHHPTQARGSYRIACACRKPAAGMLRDAARDLDLDLPRCVMFGDRESDLLAAQTAGVATRVLLNTDGTGTAAPAPASPLATARFASLAAALDDAAFVASLQAAAAPA